MKLTDFSRFRAAVTALEIPMVVDEITRALRGGDMDIELEDIICGKNGLYGLIERGGNLFVARIILHITDYKIYFLDRPGNENALRAFHRGDYDAPELRKELHKYHFSHCRTLIRMFKSNHRHRYKQSHRQDGAFRYMFIRDNAVEVDLPEMKLYVCRNCLNWLNEKTEGSLDVETFLPAIFFDQVDSANWLPDCSYETDVSMTFTGYPIDWLEISKKVREKKNYRCEECRIDLQNKSLQKFSHCHHKDGRTENSRIKNLQCLCIKCHAEQPMHGHIKRLPDYQEFLPKWEAKMRLGARPLQVPA